MLVQSTTYGSLDVKEDAVVTLSQGLPGFETFHRYAIAELGADVPFRILQCLEDQGVSFVMANPFHFAADYDFQLPEGAQEELSIMRPEEVEVWSLVTIQESLQDATMNLMAPIIVNRSNRLGKQVILHDSGYPLKYRLLPKHSAAAGVEG